MLWRDLFASGTRWGANSGSSTTSHSVHCILLYEEIPRQVPAAVPRHSSSRKYMVTPIPRPSKGTWKAGFSWHWNSLAAPRAKYGGTKWSIEIVSSSVTWQSNTSPKRAELRWMSHSQLGNMHVALFPLHRKWHKGNRGTKVNLKPMSVRWRCSQVHIHSATSCQYYGRHACHR